jgi:hypothetical protein
MCESPVHLDWWRVMRRSLEIERPRNETTRRRGGSHVLAEAEAIRCLATLILGNLGPPVNAELWFCERERLA